jgi:Tfp pilus assembly protein PilF
MMARYHLAVAFFANGDWEKASREFKTITLKTPQNSASHFQLGLSYKEAGETKRAKEAFKRAQELEPENQRVLRDLKPLETQE